MAAENWQGIVLVGGASRRMGRPKALISREGTSQAVYLATLLEATLASPTWFVGDLTGLPLASCLPDREPGAGPLSALLGAYDAMPDANLVVIACDMFRFNQAALDWLLQWCHCEASAVWPRLPGRPFGEPLAALYRQQARPVLQAAWQSGERAINRALDQTLRVDPLLPLCLVPAFSGANTPEELHALNAAVDPSEATSNNLLRVQVTDP